MTARELTYVGVTYSGKAAARLVRTATILAALGASTLLRPTAFGQMWTAYGMLFLAAAFVLSLAGLINQRVPTLRLKRHNAGVALLTSLLWVYLLSQAVMLHSNGLEFAVKATVANLGAALMATVVLNGDSANRIFFQSLVVGMSIIGWSQVVTALLGQTIPLDALQIGHMEIEGYRNAGAVYFPLSLYYADYTSYGVVLPRFSGWFREPGIAQAFFTWGLVYALAWRMRKWIAVGLIGGVVTTFSTSGVGVLAATLSIWFLTRGKVPTAIRVVASLVAAAGVTFAFLYTPHIGLVAKQATHAVSVVDRVEAIGGGLGALLADPVGKGFYGSVGVKHSGITLLAAADEIGAIGVALAVTSLLAPAIVNRSTKEYWVLVAPILATGLLAQPLLDAPLVYVGLLARLPYQRARDVGPCAPQRYEARANL